MTPKDAMNQVIGFGQFLTRQYVEDLSDADLLVRSVPGSNHIAWQLGHLLTSNKMIIGALGQSVPELPAGFEDAYKEETATVDDPSRFHKKAEYLALMEQAGQAAFAAVEAVPDADLDKPSPEHFREYAPTIGAVLMLLGTHWLMHVGQFVPIRRKLGKAPLF